MDNIKSYDELINESEGLNEAKGIHPAIKGKLEAFINNNPGCKFKDAARHIGKAMKGWKLTKEDFDECVKSCEGKKGGSKKADKKAAKEAFFASKKK